MTFALLFFFGELYKIYILPNKGYGPRAHGHPEHAVA